MTYFIKIHKINDYYLLKILLILIVNIVFAVSISYPQAKLNFFLPKQTLVYHTGFIYFTFGYGFVYSSYLTFRVCCFLSSIHFHNFFGWLYMQSCHPLFSWESKFSKSVVESAPDPHIFFTLILHWKKAVEFIGWNNKKEIKSSNNSWNDNNSLKLQKIFSYPTLLDYMKPICAKSINAEMWYKELQLWKDFSFVCLVVTLPSSNKSSWFCLCFSVFVFMIVIWFEFFIFFLLIAFAFLFFLFCDEKWNWFESGEERYWSLLF